MTSKALFLSAIALVSSIAFATPPQTPILDGRMNEYDDADHRASYTGGLGSFGAENYLSDIYVTWDSNYLYVALAGAENNNKLVLMLDVDPGSGTGATTTTNWLTGPTYITFNDVGWEANATAPAFGLDYMVASEGFYNNTVRIIYDGVDAPDSNNVISLFDSGNGGTPLGTPVDMAVYGDATACTLKGYEARIPWSVLYGANTGRFGTVNGGEIVPQGATIRLFANLHNNTPSAPYSASDSIPLQTNYAAGLLISDTYLDLIIDTDLDGFPDVAAGDVNAPWIRYASGVSSQNQVFVQFNEPVQDTSATDTNNWLVGGAQPGAVTMLTTNTLVLTLTNELPAAGTLALITTTNIADQTGNQRLTGYCLTPSASGLTNTLTVRFVLESASGLGLNPGASNYFINGGSFPLEFGYPPSTSSPLAVLSGTVLYRDVIFPPGTPATLSYKYSGQLTNTGTNNYEAVRLTDYANASRVLTLNSTVSSMTITDYLGAAAGPWRDPATNTFYAALYADPNRGAAGVRNNTVVTFALNLSQRNRSIISRVIVQGSDPLRGFNLDGTTPVGVSDYAGSGAVGWNVGGIQLYDDGTHGDTLSNDGIYMRDWLWSVDGTDASTLFEPDYPYSLVAGGFSGPPPFYGANWTDGRSPRSFKYKFYVVKNDLSYLESPTTDQEYYLEDGAGTNITLATFTWDNEALPLPPASNSPALIHPVIVSSNQVRVLFSNETNELQHGIWIATNLLQGWMDFGQRAAGSGGSWTALVNNANPGAEFYAAFAGPAQAYQGVYIENAPLPSTGGTLRLWYNQHSRGLAGDRAVQMAGSFNGWSPQPMTYAGNGSWYFDAFITPAAGSNITFKPRNLSGSTWEGFNGGGTDYITYKGFGRCIWSPLYPTNGEALNIDYDTATGPLMNATSVFAHIGYDEGWLDTADYPMTNTGGTAWNTVIAVSTSRTLSVNIIFNGQTNGSATVLWDNETAGRFNRAFITPRPYGN